MPCHSLRGAWHQAMLTTVLEVSKVGLIETKARILPECGLPLDTYGDADRTKI